MDTMRILDQHIDRSLLPIDPVEAAKYQFIWDMSAPPQKRHAEAEAACTCRRPGADEKNTLVSESMELRRSKSTPTESSRLLSIVRRGVKAPRQQMQKLLRHNKDETENIGEQIPQQEHDGLRRWSEATLVERRSCQEERKWAKE